MPKYKRVITITSIYHDVFEAEDFETAQRESEELDHESMCSITRNRRAYDYDSQCDWEDIEELCEFCNEELKSFFNIPCCEKLVEKLRAEKREQFETPDQVKGDAK